MGRISDKFTELKEKREKALVSYLMVGYPDYETSLKAFKEVLKNGTDILEIGFPFSDPVADGPTIQVAHEVALKNGIRFEDVLELSETLRKEFPDIPFLLMTYYNPIFRIGLEKFCRLSREKGIDGFIVPDLPPEEAEELKAVMKKYVLSFVPLGAPTSTRKRIKLICEAADEMTYFVSVTGTTGAREKLPYERIKKKVEEYRELCDKPVVVGFGVSKKEHAREIGSFADGVVVGSALVKLAGQKKIEDLGNLVKELKEGLRE
ncbi:tryptophan synthase subunit alpha [Aquifex aeolicus]|uniref:Tryptophan synthase alpha chain n=1 Tax=Aquifex aeolicus (strain VF5) TaxID=224324 RepID=TRPA_AQUAE|nr:tryptophan synthase subunit alpha [Aquifex aeolicus]O67502.1 RecName: Full=Tryptophan synthase alpha chain [Aquifex aeolicus VF5]AAC07458.1 tryptophan synthase alpha subunit [Aquifex aeolicus VF5]2EKC_A Chain A, Tryptophan synthase alpha chain [Aquifex aeolicus VF5]2EKC_B Chain B, Tryptophan synthase alpha chain [Aquifex aeolicus VF5]